MAKLSQAELKTHAHAEALLKSDKILNLHEVIDVLCDWHEGATHSNAATSAFFTPYELALNFALEVPNGGHVLDLCAGIGTLSAAALVYHNAWRDRFQFTLVELDERYCEVARRLLPDATIICGSVFDPAVQEQLAATRFDFAISNPPYGSRNVAIGKGPRYTGSKCEYAVIDIASDLADHGAFLIPQSSVPFRHTGTNSLKMTSANMSEEYARFLQATQIELLPNLGIDTSFAERLWRGTSIRTEIAICDFVAARKARSKATITACNSQADLFGLAA